MDPAATLLSALMSMNDVGHVNDDPSMLIMIKEDASYHLRNLADWLDRGGYTPDAQAIARSFLSRVEE